MTETTPTPAAGFYGLGIAPKLLEALDKLNFKTPTPIQHKAIPPASEGKDMVGIAQTGTGKTIAFAIPMIQRLAATGQGKGLVVVPTRELALQVAEVVRQFSPLMGMGCAVIIGGESMNRQTAELRKGPRIIIATPGRLIDHVAQRTVSLSDVRVLVLDEADRMFDMGFAPQIEKIVAALPRERQTMLFSATMPDPIMKLASRHMKLPLRIEVARPGTAAERVEQELFIVDRSEKTALLAKLLDKYWGSVLLFVRTKHNAKKIARAIREMPHSASEIHSNRSLSQRKEALEGFKSGKYRVLVATDIAARGIDVTGIELVINYDLPDEDENYVHRIGRTGRAGQPGRAITFAAPDQGADVRNIERLIRMPLTRIKLPDVASADFGAPEAPRPGARPAPAPAPHQPRGERPRQQGRPQRPGQQRQGSQRGQPRQGAPRGDGRRPGPSDRKPDFSRGESRGPARRGRPQAERAGQPNRYGVNPDRKGGIVSLSPYFDEPRRHDGPRRQGRQDARQPEPQKPPQGGNWFTRFLKKKKTDYKNE
ncbi:MAG: DEAD/DEAH box helicase [Elusimicrobiales bacterium]|nr:DEAD/DEAH box helicase [Elusimicrobiales bacterium]